MATKKKKQTKVVQEEVQQDPKISMTNTTKYAGNVTVKIFSGKSVISTKTYHNNGRSKLFEFVCKALAGNLVEDLRPCKVAAFSLYQTEEKPASPIFNNGCRISPYLLNDVSAVIKQLDDGSWHTYYHFRIPYAYLQTDSEGKTNIYKIGLYPNTIGGAEAANQCAYFCFTKSSHGETVWDPIILNNTSTGNFSLVIEWDMTISNK